jgi:hypothetical protein
LPKADYYPLLVVAEFLDDETVVIANDAAKVASVLVPSPHDIIRVRSRLGLSGGVQSWTRRRADLESSFVRPWKIGIGEA